MQNHLRKSKQQCLFTHSNTYATKENPIEKEEQTTTTTTNNINRNSSTNTGKTKPNILIAEQRHRSAPKIEHHMEIITLKNWRKSKEEEQNAHKQKKRFLLEKKIHHPSCTERGGLDKTSKSSSQKNKRMLALHILWRIVTRNIF